MKTVSKVHIILLTTVVFFTMAIPAYCALATQTTSGDDVFADDIVKTAAGTKLSGPLTIYYAPSISSGNVDMHMFLRLRKGYSLYAFSTVYENVEYKTAVQPVRVMEFLLNEVVPELYCDPGDPKDSDYPAECTPPPFEIKSVEERVQDNYDCAYCSDYTRQFSIVDIVIAVQD